MRGLNIKFNINEQVETEESGLLKINCNKEEGQKEVQERGVEEVGGERKIRNIF